MTHPDLQRPTTHQPRGRHLVIAFTTGATAALLACTAPAPDAGSSAAVEPPGTESSDSDLLPVIEGPQLVLEPHHVRVGTVVREPMLVEHPSGLWFLTGYGTQDPANSSPRQALKLWQSADEGENWTAVDVGTVDDGAFGNSDVDLAVGPEGNLYFAAMRFDRTTFRGTHVTMGASSDTGASWRWNVISDSEFDDRPWVRATPDGRVHAVWNDGAGVAYARSPDGGTTWNEQPRIHDAGGSSHLAVGPDGELAVRIGPMSASGNRNHPGEDWIATSVDGGASWTLRPPPGNGRWPASIAELGTHPRWVDPLAWSARGDLLHAWTADDGLQIARSADQGAAWTIWAVAAPPPGGALFFPYLSGGFEVARGDRSRDQFALSWFERNGDVLRARVARLRFEAGALHVERTAPLSLPIHRLLNTGGEVSRTPDTGGEYFPALISRDGRVVAATPIQGDPQGDGFTIWREPPS